MEYKQIEHVESARSQELGSSRRSCIACSLIYSKKELKYRSESHVRRTAHVICRSTIHSKLKNLASPTTLFTEFCDVQQNFKGRQESKLNMWNP
jgi:hypothetical protein